MLGVDVESVVEWRSLRACGTVVSIATYLHADSLGKTEASEASTMSDVRMRQSRYDATGD